MEPMDGRPGGTPLEDMVELIGKRLTTGLVLAAGIVGLAIYARPGPPRYQIVSDGAQVVRVDTRNGSMISCSPAGCVSLHRPGGKIERKGKLPAAAVPAPSAPAQIPAAAASPPAAPQAPAAG